MNQEIKRVYVKDGKLVIVNTDGDEFMRIGNKWVKLRKGKEK